jgi:hypothetical protein
MFICTRIHIHPAVILITVFIFSNKLRWDRSETVLNALAPVWQINLRANDLDQCPLNGAMQTPISITMQPVAASSVQRANCLICSDRA